MPSWPAGVSAVNCTPGPVTPNPNPNFTGVYQSWLDCGGMTADLHVLVANPLDGRQTTIVIVVQTLTPADEEALKVAFSSYAQHHGLTPPASEGCPGYEPSLRTFTASVFGTADSPPTPSSWRTSTRKFDRSRAARRSPIVRRLSP